MEREMGFLLCRVGLVLSLGVVGCGSQYEISCANVKATETRGEQEMDEAKKELMARTVNRRTEQSAVEGTIVHYEEFPSEFIRVRPVDVWLPEGYDAASGDRYPVIYMHDGQMMFDHHTSPYAGWDLFWDVDKAITRLVGDGEIRPAIVVSSLDGQLGEGCARRRIHAAESGNRRGLAMDEGAGGGIRRRGRRTGNVSGQLPEVHRS